MDKIQRFLLENLHVRGEWVSLQSSWDTIQNTIDYPVPVRNVLGEALAAISLLAESLKFDGSITLQIRGTQPVTMLVVQAYANGGIRGIARWNEDDKAEIADDASFNELFGAGTMVISVENNPKKGAQQGERYQSLVSLKGASLAECFKEYFAQSEQLKTQLWLSADENRATGLMLQSLPEDDLDKVTQENNWVHATMLAQTIKDEELLSLGAEDLLHRLYHDEDLRIFEPKPLHFECTCSQQKIENTVQSLGEKEVNEILVEQGSINIDCEFCNKHYELDKVDVKRLFSDGEVAGDEGCLH
ncbi:MAG TPA: Hsp33 family molecular chaperone HslO [Leucothrix sp.]|nr:Hsp33 family molecular chaperone HslO [Leucothrix sp.]